MSAVPAPVEKAAETVSSTVSNAVNDVAETLSNTNLNSNKAAANEAASASAAEGRRLYIGNLAYATTEEELKGFFKSYLVESVSIPKNPRTDRPVGYAFVDLSTPTEAERAIEELSGKEILERKVSVQLARKPEAAADKAAEAPEAAGGEGTRRRASGRGRGRGRNGRGGRSARAEGEEKKDETAEGAAAAGPTGVVATDAPPAATNEVPQPLADITNAMNNTDTSSKAAANAQQRQRRERGPPADGVPSKTKVMLINLFKDYQPTSAKIALRPIPRFMIKKLQARGEARKGRGFGFVTLASEELQQKAVAEMNAKDIEGREIAVKVAIDSPDKTDEEANTPADETTKQENTKPAEQKDAAAVPAAVAAPTVV
ncbi:Single-stranded TG1-3 DNA-binding protein-like protein [Emericellopsis cladophorae]|uniref:Single-stranded TG1-3 DNA-binding protein-like protein n=1 Tax=Emericellopsis cladophorae TaxID=2686198 RepID=A0A9Q0BDD1_9HYPO|nr:Single-stranded TG1-3 DNA-binding protein-like protein [Emericellopsis cladophorae]KAI6780425.1 Single-stranded TG1-3 DNA-binding protein-like protein [Emericellopsis cladophorae]